MISKLVFTLFFLLPSNSYKIEKLMKQDQKKFVCILNSKHSFLISRIFS